MRTKFWQNYFLGKGFAKTSAHLFLNSDVANGKGGVWGGMRASKKETGLNHCLSHFSAMYCPSLKGMHPRHPPRAFPLWLLAPRCLCAGKQIVKRLKYQKMSRLLDCPLFLGRGSFLSPGRAIYSESTRSTPSPSPLYALYIYVRGVAFATRLCDFV